MKPTRFPFLAITVFLLACHSPILEHADAQGPGSGQEKSGQIADCPLSFPGHGLCAEIEWQGAPTDQDPASFTLRFWKLNEATSHGPYTSPSETVFVRLWMPSMGHGSAPVTLLQAKDSGGQVVPGVYLGTNVNFIMPGTWQMKVQLKQGSRVTEESDLDVQI